MNIDSSSLLNLLSSADNKLENIQQSLEVNGLDGDAFAEMFQNTLNQLNDLSQKRHLPEGILQSTIENPGDALHGIADLFKATGNNLPANKLQEKEIDLNNTLDSLANVIHKLDDIAETGQSLENKIEGWLKTVERIQPVVAENSDLNLAFNQIEDELRTLNQQITGHQVQHSTTGDLGSSILADDEETLLEEIDNKKVSESEERERRVPEDVIDFQKQLSRAYEQEAIETIDDGAKSSDPEKDEGFKTSSVDKMQFAMLDETENRFSEYTIDFQQQLSQIHGQEVAETIDEVAKSIGQIKNELFKAENLVNLNSVNLNIVELKSEMENLQAEVGNMKDKFAKILRGSELTGKDSNKILEKNLDQQATEIINFLIQPSEQPKPVAESAIIDSTIQALRADLKTENLWLRQILGEKTLITPGEIETDSLLQQENTFNKSTQEPPVILSKQIEKQDLSVDHTFDVGSEKSLPKIANDLAMLNRVVERENKAELPPMTKHFSHPEWNKEMSERVIWMHKQEIPSAELRLNPKHLGPVTIKVDVTKDQATVVFTAQHAAVKEAIESAIPKLKEMFSTQQLNLVEVNVSQENPDQRQSKGFNQMAYGQNNQGHQDDTEATEKQAQEESLMDVTEEIEAGRAIASNGILSIFA